MRWSIFILLSSIVFTNGLGAGTACAEEKVAGVIAKARKLEQLGQPEDATATLAQGFQESQDLTLIDTWIALNSARVKDLDGRIKHRSVPATPKGLSDAEKKTMLMEKGGSETVTNMKKSWLTLNPLSSLWAEIDTYTAGPVFRAFREVQAEHRRRMKANQPSILAVAEARQRLASYEMLMASVDGCTRSLGQAVRDAGESQLEEVVRRRKDSARLADDVRHSRGVFLSNDYIAPRVLDAMIHVQPDDVGFVAEFVSQSSLEHAAVRLGEASGDIKYANRDVKNMYLRVLHELKQASGEKHYKDLEATATLVGDSSIGPENWKKSD